MPLTRQQHFSPSGWRWPLGSDKLLLVSLGTGSLRNRWRTDDVMQMLSAEQGLRSLQSLMDDCGRMNQALLQWLTHCLTPWIVDRAVGDMALDSQSGPCLATYIRYNVLLDAAWLKNELGVELPSERVAELAAMDKPENMEPLAELGAKVAAKQVSAAHFPAGFDGF